MQGGKNRSIIPETHNDIIETCKETLRLHHEAQAHAANEGATGPQVQGCPSFLPQCQRNQCRNCCLVVPRTAYPISQLSNMDNLLEWCLPTTP